MADTTFKFNNWDALDKLFGGSQPDSNLFGEGLFESGMPAATDSSQFAKDQAALSEGLLPGINPDTISNPGEASQTDTPDSASIPTPGLMPGMLDSIGNLFGGSLDPTGGSSALREQADLASRQAANERVNEQRERQIANRDYRVEAGKNAAAEAAIKNAQQIQNMGAATGNAAAALARKVGTPDFNTHMSRQDRSRVLANQYQREGSRLDQEAIRRRSNADMYDYAYNDMRNRNNKAAALAAGSTGNSPRPYIKDVVNDIMSNWFKSRNTQDVPGDNGSGEQTYVDDDQTSPDNNGEIGFSESVKPNTGAWAWTYGKAKEDQTSPDNNGEIGFSDDAESNTPVNTNTQTNATTPANTETNTGAKSAQEVQAESNAKTANARANARQKLSANKPDNTNTNVSIPGYTSPKPNAVIENANKPKLPTTGPGSFTAQMQEAGNKAKEMDAKAAQANARQQISNTARTNEALAHVKSDGQITDPKYIEQLKQIQGVNPDDYWYFVDKAGNFTLYGDYNSKRVNLNGKTMGLESTPRYR